MRFFMPLVGLFFSLPCAASLEQRYVKRLELARSSTEITRLKDQFEELKIARAACKLQLRAGNAPLACYDSLNLEIAWGLHPAASAKIRLRRRLDVLCADAASRLKIPRHDPHNPGISRDCREEMAAARKIQEYRSGGQEWSGN